MSFRDGTNIQRSERSREARLAELLIDSEEDRVLRAVLVGMLREGDPST